MNKRKNIYPYIEEIQIIHHEVAFCESCSFLALCYIFRVNLAQVIFNLKIELKATEGSPTVYQGILGLDDLETASILKLLVRCCIYLCVLSLGQD